MLNPFGGFPAASIEFRRSRLTDDTGRDAAAVCRFFSLRRPAAPIPLDTETVLSGFPVSLPGGLFEARHGDFQDTIIVSVPQIEGEFRAWLSSRICTISTATPFIVTFILDLLQRWSTARLLGPLVAYGEAASRRD